MIKAHHVIAPHFIHCFLCVVAPRAVYVRGKLDRLSLAAQILHAPLRITSHKANHVILSGCFIRFKVISGC
jgi:hypothetical protein